MSDPILLQIAKAFSTRLAVIQVADGYHTDLGLSVHRGRRVPQLRDCPLVNITLSNIESSDLTAADSLLIAPIVTIVGYHAIEDNHQEDVALRMGQDIHRAMELPFSPVGVKDDLVKRVRYKGDDIGYPDADGKVVSIAVPYEFTFRRRYGDPIT